MEAKGTFSKVGLKETTAPVQTSTCSGAFLFSTRMILQIDPILLSHTDKDELWLLTQMAIMSNKKGICNASNFALCNRTEWHIQKLQRVKQSLSEKKFIKTHPRSGTRNNRLANSYIIITPLIRAKPQEV